METRSPVSVDFAQSRMLSVEVATRGAGSTRGHVRGISADEIRARFQASSSMLALGTQVSLRFSGSQMKRSVSSTASVLERRDEENHREYVFKLLKADEIVPVLLPHIQKVGNRRGAVRIRPSGSIPVDLVSDKGNQLRASLFDISASGMSLRVSQKEEAALASSTKLDVRTALPGRPPFELYLRASIRERRFTDELVHLGLAFLPEESPDFSTQEQTILQYVFATCAAMQGTPLPGRFGTGESSDE